MDELINSLASLTPGQCASVPYELFEDIFPPGVEHDPAKEAAYHVAKRFNCSIENRPHERAVYFVKDA
jgi:hypothetical protein